RVNLRGARNQGHDPFRLKFDGHLRAGAILDRYRETGARSLPRLRIFLLCRLRSTATGHSQNRDQDHRPGKKTDAPPLHPSVPSRKKIKKKPTPPSRHGETSTKSRDQNTPQPACSPFTSKGEPQVSGENGRSPGSWILAPPRPPIRTDSGILRL